MPDTEPGLGHGINSANKSLLYSHRATFWGKADQNQKPERQTDVCTGILDGDDRCGGWKKEEGTVG